MGPVPQHAPEDVAEAVAVFARDHYVRLLDPAYAHDRCHDISQRFVGLCRSLGLPAELIHGMQFGETPEFPGVTLALRGHVAVKIEDTVIDWTARQFDPSAPVPRVTTTAHWQEQWPPLGGSG